jgi:hypothetical protein
VRANLKPGVYEIWSRAIDAGSGRMFTRPVRFICMFQGNLNGLKIGAPVKVRGVQIGTVATIQLRLLPSQGRMLPGIKGLRLPVIIGVDRSQVLARGATGEALGTAGFDDWIKKGMRAQLATESLFDRTSVYRSRSAPQHANQICAGAGRAVSRDTDRSDRPCAAPGTFDAHPR